MTTTVGPLLLYGLLAVLLSWPLAALNGEALSQRPDFSHNVWNAWWVGQALFEHGTSPYWTDWLYQPDGVSLAFQTLSPVNSVSAALLVGVLDPADAFALLLLVHFVLSGWFGYLFARELTGCAQGALLAGVVWSFAPYHFHYLAQINLATMEFLPLAGFFMVRAYRRGRLVDVLGVVAAAALLAASSFYYLVYAALFGGLLLVGGPLWARGTAFLTGARRLALAGAASALAVAVVAWPLLSAFMNRPPGQATPTRNSGMLERAANDLLGFRWITGPPELEIVSWPTMLGYAALALVLAGGRTVWRQPFWWLSALLFGVLSLGSTLSVNGAPTELTLPFDALLQLPLLETMLRKPQRLFVMAQLMFCVLVAFGWRDVRARLPADRRRLGAFLVALVVLSAETFRGPLLTFPIDRAAPLHELARDEQIESVVSLPVLMGTEDSRNLMEQTLHGKKITRGYVTSLVLTPERVATMDAWIAANDELVLGHPEDLLARIAAADVDAVILHRTVISNIYPGVERPKVTWAPFCVVGGALVDARQRTPLDEARMDPRFFQEHKRVLGEAFGPPISKGDGVLVYRVR